VRTGGPGKVGAVLRELDFRGREELYREIWRYGEGRSCTVRTGGPGKVGAVLRELVVRGM